jgi:hypothetical protein
MFGIGQSETNYFPSAKGIIISGVEDWVNYFPWNVLPKAIRSPGSPVRIVLLFQA